MGLLDAICGRKTGAGINAEVYEPGSAAALERLWQRLESCPICGRDFGGHQFALVATTILGPSHRRRIGKYLKAVEQRMPKELAPFREWDATGENAEGYAIRCADDKVAIAVVHSGAAEPRFRNVIRCDSLGAERSRELIEIVARDRWRAIYRSATAAAFSSS